MNKTKKLIAGLIVAGAITGGAVLPVTAASAATVQPQGMRVCKQVLVQKKLPWYQCINTMPGTNYLPPACYGNVYKTVCTQY